MSVTFQNLAIAYSPDQIRGLSEGVTRKGVEVILLPGRGRWMFIPNSTEADDGVDWLLPSWLSADQDGRWGRWQVSGGGGGGDDSDDVTLPIEISDVNGLEDALDGIATLPITEGDVTGLVSDLSTLSSAISSEASARSSADALLVPKSRVLTTTAPLKIDAGASADLSADRTLSIDLATTSVKGAVVLATPSSDTTAGHAVQASDTRLSDARTPTSHAASHEHGGGDEVATATPAANVIPKAGAGGKLAAGFMSAVLASSDLTNDAALEKTANKGAASGYASLNGSTKVVEDPANATATPTASKIVIADGSGKVDGWVTDGSTSVKGLLRLATDAESSATKAVKADDSRLAGGTVSTAEILMLKSFFVANSLMPGTTHLEALNTYPVPDFASGSGSGASHSDSMGRRRTTLGSTSSTGVWGWDMGGLKSRVLFIMGMTREKPSELDMGIADAAPASGAPGDKSFLNLLIPTTTRLYKYVSAAYTQLAEDTSVASGGSVRTAGNVMRAMYYDDATDRLILFLKYGGEQWFPVLDITNTSLTTVRYCWLNAGATGGGQDLIFWSGCPVGIYYDN